MTNKTRLLNCCFQCGKRIKYHTKYQKIHLAISIFPPFGVVELLSTCLVFTAPKSSPIFCSFLKTIQLFSLRQIFSLSKSQASVQLESTNRLCICHSLSIPHDVAILFSLCVFDIIYNRKLIDIYCSHERSHSHLEVDQRKCSR